MVFINRETVCEKLNEIGGCDADPDSWADGWDKAISEAIKIVEGMPVSDAFEVVRCKDCMHYDYIENYCDLWGVTYRVIYFTAVMALKRVNKAYFDTT